jgi:hypothetical protein
MGKGKGDAPDPPDYGPIAAASEKAADLGFQISKEQLQWAKDRWAADKEVSDYVVKKMLTRSDMQDAWSKEDRARYQETFKPIEDRMVREAQEYDTPEKRAEAAQRDMASVATQGEAARQASERHLQGYGVDPTTLRGGALDRSARLMTAAAQAGAGNAAEQRVEDTGYARMANAANLGKGFQINPLAASQAAQGGNQAAGAQQLATTASGASTMGTGAQWAGVGQGALGNWANALNMGYNNALAQYNANQQGSSGIGGLLGLAGSALTLFDDGGAVPPPSEGLPVSGPPAAVPAGGPPTAIPVRSNTVAVQMSPSGGEAKDDVPAALTAGEFIMPAEAVRWYGEKQLHNMIAKADKERNAPKQAQPQYAAAPQQAIPA